MPQPITSSPLNKGVSAIKPREINKQNCDDCLEKPKKNKDSDEQAENLHREYTKLFSNPQNLPPIKKVLPIRFIDAAEFEKLKNSKEKPVVFYITADWCSNCKEFEPIFSKIFEQNKDITDFYQIDFDKPGFQKIFEKYEIDKTPFMITFHKGKVIRREIVLIDKKPAIKPLLPVKNDDDCIPCGRGKRKIIVD